MRLIIGISGASGVYLGYRLLEFLRTIPDTETALVITDGAKRTFALETDLTVEAVAALADTVYANDDLAAPIASGSYPADGMIIIPASMKTVAGLAAGYAENLLLRAGDVCLKEGRPLVISPREMPLSRIHLRNLAELAASGCRIVPPLLTFYGRDISLEQQIRQIFGKILAPFQIKVPGFFEWGTE